MAISNKRGGGTGHAGGIPGFSNPPNPDLQMLFSELQSLGSVVNNQAGMIRNLTPKVMEMQFRMHKLDEQVQILKMFNRVQRDRFLTFTRTIIDLGIVDKDLFEVAFSMIEGKSLPITSDGKINSQIALSRYNHSKKLEPPPGSVDR